jgi:hypothetical protein
VKLACEFELCRGQRRRATSSSVVAGTREVQGQPEARGFAVGGGERRRERREKREEEAGRRDGDDMWARRHVAATSPKPPCKTARWPKNERFQEFEGQRFPVFAFDCQNQTFTIVRWSKMDFFQKKTAQQWPWRRWTAS